MWESRQISRWINITEQFAKLCPCRQPSRRVVSSFSGKALAIQLIENLHFEKDFNFRNPQ
jgi:hypothetical protein